MEVENSKRIAKAIREELNILGKNITEEDERVIAAVIRLESFYLKHEKNDKKKVNLL